MKKRRSHTGTRLLAVLTLMIGLTLSGAWAQAPVIPDLDVSGPAPDFEMGSRLMTSGKRMEAWLTVPEKGKVKLLKFNGTFFYRHTSPAATTATLLFQTDQLQNVDGKMAKELTKTIDARANPWFGFQSRSATATDDGVDLIGKLIVGAHEPTPCCTCARRATGHRRSFRATPRPCRTPAGI